MAGLGTQVEDLLLSARAMRGRMGSNVRWHTSCNGTASGGRNGNPEVASSGGVGKLDHALDRAVEMSRWM